MITTLKDIRQAKDLHFGDEVLNRCRRRFGHGQGAILELLQALGFIAQNTTGVDVYIYAAAG